MDTLATYLEQLGSMKANRVKGRISPYKAIMLLSIIDLVEAGKQTDNHIYYTDALKEAFFNEWNLLIGSAKEFASNPEPAMPFWSLGREPFWYIQPKIDTPENREICSRAPESSSARSIAQYCDYAVIDSELIELFKSADSRKAIREYLIKHYTL